MRLVAGGRELLRALMTIRGLTVLELARLCGNTKHRSAIGHLLSGKRQTCSAELAGKLQEVLGNDKVVIFEPRVYRVTRDSETTR